MRLATLYTAEGRVAARIEGDTAIVLPYPGLDALLAHEDWRERAATPGTRELPFASAECAPLVTSRKVICVGLNYRTHILEMGRELPSRPTLFGKFPEVLTGAYEEIAVPSVSSQMDWEAELGVVIGAPAYRVSEEDAADRIAGYSVVNDVSMRDWQWRTTQWLSGKNFEASTPVGPVLATPDEVDHARDLRLTCEVDGEVMQSATTADLVFSPTTIVSYASQFITLRPGDLIAAGTPGGVGAGRDPRVFLRPGQTLQTTVEGIGSCANPIVEDKQ